MEYNQLINLMQACASCEVRITISEFKGVTTLRWEWATGLYEIEVESWKITIRLPHLSRILTEVKAAMALVCDSNV